MCVASELWNTESKHRSFIFLKDAAIHQLYINKTGEKIWKWMWLSSLADMALYYIIVYHIRHYVLGFFPHSLH